MILIKTNLAGLDYLAAATDLLRRIRLEDAAAGLYEAAEVQWWWREEDAADPRNQTFWRDARGDAIACLTRFDAGPEWHSAFFSLPSAGSVVREAVLPEAVTAISTAEKPSTITVRDDDDGFRELLTAAGFAAGPTATVRAELAGESPRPRLEYGFQVRSRDEELESPHHLAARNGPEIARKLSECSLYRPDLDLSLRGAPGGAPAAYALFWIDPITRLGLIEPVRTEAAYLRRGLARYLVAEGIRRLRALGAEAVTVSYREDNAAAARLYRECGFRDRFRKVDYRK